MEIPLRSLMKRLVGVVVVSLFAGGTLLAQPDSTNAIQRSDMHVKVDGSGKEVVKDTNTVQGLQLRARKDKDVVRLTCINDKLLQIRALRNIFDNLRGNFETSESAADYDQIVATTISIRQLREQAQVCAGETQFISDMQNGYTGPDIPDDPSKDLFPNGPEQPGYASPYN